MPYPQTNILLLNILPQSKKRYVSLSFYSNWLLKRVDLREITSFIKRRLFKKEFS